MVTQTFRERENQQQQKSRDQFRWKEKQKLYSGGEKMRKASGFQGEMRCSEKTVIGNTNISSIKCATRKLKEVPRFSRAKQQQRNAQKSMLHVQISFFANQNKRVNLSFC